MTDQNTTLSILEKLIAFPTVSKESNLPMIGYLREFLLSRGFAVHQIDDHTGEKAGLFASIGPKSEGGVLLSAHTDVVPVEGQDWRKEPFKLTRQDERVFGRGTTDMKGYLASVLALADRASKLELAEPLKLSFSYDEEIGCVGIKEMIGKLESTIGKPRICVVGEPTEMQVAVGHKGKVALRATCRGENGHSAMAPNFLNALHPAVDFVNEIRNLQDEFAKSGPRDDAYDIPYTTLHVGKLAGGRALNMVPNLALIDFEFRHLAEHDALDIEKQLLQIAQRLSEKHKLASKTPCVSIEIVNAYPGLNMDINSEAVPEIQSLIDNKDTINVPFGTEAGYFFNLGIPTLVCGPGSMSEQGHKPDESIAISELQKCDEMHERLLAKMTV